MIANIMATKRNAQRMNGCIAVNYATREKDWKRGAMAYV